MAIESKEKKTTSPEKRAKETQGNLGKILFPVAGVSAFLMGAAPIAMLFAGLTMFPPENKPYKPFLLDKIGDAISGITKPGKYI